MSQTSNSDITEYSIEEKYFLLLLYAPTNKNNYGAAVRGSLLLQKEMFLLSKEFTELRVLKFDEDMLGPFSSSLEAIQNQYTNSQFVEQRYEQGPIKLTDKGMTLAKRVWKLAADNITQKIRQVKIFLGGLKHWEVISFIYSKYPETTTNSEILEEFKQNRLDSAIHMYKKQKVLIDTAAMVAGLSLDNFIEVLKDRDIRPIKTEVNPSNKALADSEQGNYFIHKLKDKNYEYFARRIKEMSARSNFESNFQTISQIQNAFKQFQSNTMDYFLKLELENIVFEMENVRKLMFQIIEKREDKQKITQLKRQMQLLNEKLKTTAETEKYLKEIGVDEDELMRSAEVTNNDDGSVDIIWKNRGLKKSS
jgi:predicted HTH domain antitoxin